jgi:aspartyl-tRNA(Asn)/glutamyl-tRNA(Gln) amidotransferase subunit B
MMNSVYDKYQVVVGLEVHAQLTTLSKAYASDSNEFGAMPNTNVSAITLGHPGTLPRANKKVIEFAVKLGLALNCEIREWNEYARKNYFYADLPKGYQITQDKTPICINGYVMIKDAEGKDKKIRIERIHMEEDAGKSMHDQDPFDSLIDLNRAGVPLLEIVSMPDLRSSVEAYNYLTEVRKILRYLEVCDGNMDEGSMRCDANVSVMLKEASEFGNRCEVKNMNSIRNVARAIDYEAKRQVDEIEKGNKISQDTRSFEAVSGTTFLLRSKEQANDYRYFPEPDLQPVIVSTQYIDEIKSTLPPLPQQLIVKYINELGLNEYDATHITENKQTAIYFEELLKHTKSSKTAANWLMGTVRSYLNENAIDIENFALSPSKLAELISLVEDGKVSITVATQQIFPILINNSTITPIQIAEENNWIQVSDEGSIESIAREVIARFPDKVAEYKNGKKGLIGMFMGEVMKASKSKADPKVASAIVTKLLEE